VFRRWGAAPPVVHSGWFSETLDRELPNEIAFCYLDGDFYESIITGLEAVVPRLTGGGVLIVDDYSDLELAPKSWNGLPGVKKACDDYFTPRGISMQPLIGVGDLSFALYRKPRR
jgi:O-methyltransferase